MGPSSSASLLLYYSRRRTGATGVSGGVATSALFFLPTSLALLTSLLFVLYLFSTSTISPPHHLPLPDDLRRSQSPRLDPPGEYPVGRVGEVFAGGGVDAGIGLADVSTDTKGVKGGTPEINVYHDRDIFLTDYRDMNRSFKIYIYPHRSDDLFKNVFAAVNFDPEGNYASESFFKKNLVGSHFVTDDHSSADLFFMPFSIARLRHDKRVGVAGIQDFIRDYVAYISREYPYWNRTGGADHFYVACHSIGRSAMRKANAVRLNGIQVVCSSSYHLSGYVSHKDASLPQIWPRHGDLPDVMSSRRARLAFFAGGMNSHAREKLFQFWTNDSEIFVHRGRLPTRYSDELLGSKFCLHVKGFEVNTARVADSLYYGCVPVIIANHYDLPFSDVLNWKSFSVVVATLDIPLLKKILKGIDHDQYTVLQSNVMQVRKHFQWHSTPLDYDAFHMVMLELWLRRSSVRVPLNGF
ncbi:hypothetical protein MLD38_004560 [Melastoma candidum]|uniref:Uncharacterized protein n=1 Tax=Melastoma candidum TaxID=119954 RepID=A0ACB9S9Z4_9MYRT|nr:hypothetical protein MLD38_004560 [Melastoma candidum]